MVEVKYDLNLYLFAVCVKEGNRLLFVLELHEQREVGNHKDNISS